jgi:hypothetical protein
MAFVFGDPSAPGAIMEPSITQMRCSWCKELKPCCACTQGECRHLEASAFPPSCAQWRRGACKQCRAAKARKLPLLKRKLESARHRYGSVKPVSLAHVEHLLHSCCGTDTLSDTELSEWRIVKRDARQPFSAENAIWVKRGGKAQVAQHSGLAPPVDVAAAT